MDYVFDIHHGSTVIPDDVGAVAVIDGSEFRESNTSKSPSDQSLTRRSQKT